MSTTTLLSKLALFVFLAVHLISDVRSQMWGPGPGIDWWGPRRPWWRRYQMGRPSWREDSPWGPNRGDQWNNDKIGQGFQDPQNSNQQNSNQQSTDKMGQGFQDPQRDRWTQQNRDGPVPPTITQNPVEIQNPPGPPSI